MGRTLNPLQSFHGSLAKKCIYMISKGYSLIGGLPTFVWVSVSNRIGSSKFRQYSKYKCEIWALDTNALRAGVLPRPIGLST